MRPGTTPPGGSPSLFSSHRELPKHCAVCGCDWPAGHHSLCKTCGSGLPCRADTTDTVAPDPPCQGSRNRLVPQATSPSGFGCSFPGCDRHPRKGDTILRISAKGAAFVGRCEDHYGDETGPELARSAEAAAREATG